MAFSFSSPVRFPYRILRAVLAWTLAGTLVLALLLAYLWRMHPLLANHGSAEFEILPGQPARSIVQSIRLAGVGVPALLIEAAMRFGSKERSYRPGIYRIDAGLTLSGLIARLARGEFVSTEVRIIEGWTFRQIRQALLDRSDLRPVLVSIEDRDLMARFGEPGVAPEGQFYPDTYVVPKGTQDILVLQQAHQEMVKHLAQAWDSRAADCATASPQQTLILASLVEKESALPADRPMVAAVLSNRLRIGMLLQTDPAVIYGLGADYDGHLHKRDLALDTPFNTYRRKGLPPTPIAMPGADALQAATHPARSNVLYFVARGDGSSEFSVTLAAHERAVVRYRQAVSKGRS